MGPRLGVGGVGGGGQTEIIYSSISRKKADYILENDGHPTVSNAELLKYSVSIIHGHFTTLVISFLNKLHFMYIRYTLYYYVAILLLSILLISGSKRKVWRKN